MTAPAPSPMCPGERTGVRGRASKGRMVRERPIGGANYKFPEVMRSAPRPTPDLMKMAACVSSILRCALERQFMLGEEGDAKDKPNLSWNFLFS